MRSVPTVVALLVLTGCAGAAIYDIGLTPGEQFRRTLIELAADCAVRPGSRCNLLKVQVEDPLATPEGRFAHAIKIPNPVPADSGYRRGMSSDEYFEHLCKTEAGEFIFKTVDNVEGIRLLRPRTFYLLGPPMLHHLYGMEDPYGHDEDEADLPALQFLRWPQQYRYIEAATGAIPVSRVSSRAVFNPSVFAPPSQGLPVHRLYGYDGTSNFKSLHSEYSGQYESRYAITWRGLKRPNDREMGVAGGELIVLDMSTGEVLGVRRGYAQWSGRGWGRLCPRYGYYGGSDKATSFSFWFVGKVARPPHWQEYFASMEQYRAKH